jgi:hypothetical protein
LHPNIFFTLLLPSLVLAGCISHVRPEGDWLSSPDLRLSNKSLENVNIALECGYGEPDNWQPDSGGDECLALQRALVHTGAAVTRIVEDEDRKKISADFRVVYDIGDWSSDFCGPLPGGQVLLFIFTIGTYPCIEDFEVTSELRIYDKSGVLAERHAYNSKVRKIYGWYALLKQLGRLANVKQFREFKRQNREQLLTSVRNKVYTYAYRQQMLPSKKDAH